MSKVFNEDNYIFFDENNTNVEDKQAKYLSFFKKFFDRLNVKDKSEVADLQLLSSKIINAIPEIISPLCKCLMTSWDETKSSLILDHIFKKHKDELEESAVLHQLESIHEGDDIIQISMMTRAASQKRMIIIDLLLEHSIDIHSKDESCDFLTVLSMYAKPLTIKKVLKRGGIDVNGTATNKNNLNPINVSIRHGAFDVTALLLQDDSFNLYHPHHEFPQKLNKDIWTNFPINPLFIYLKPNFQFLYTSSKCRPATILCQMLDSASDNKSKALSIVNKTIYLEEGIKNVKADYYTLFMLAMLRQTDLKHQIPLVDVFCQYPGINLNIANSHYGSCWDIAQQQGMKDKLQKYAIAEATRVIDKISSLLSELPTVLVLAADSPLNQQSKLAKKIKEKLKSYHKKNNKKDPMKLLMKIAKTIGKLSQSSNNNNNNINSDNDVMIEEINLLIEDCLCRVDPKSEVVYLENEVQSRLTL